MEGVFTTEYWTGFFAIFSVLYERKRRDCVRFSGFCLGDLVEDREKRERTWRRGRPKGIPGGADE